MDKEELKKIYSMKDVIKMYGFETNNSDFSKCPFHEGTDAMPQMKIYADHYHCHKCGAHGDIFTFVQHMENCTFPETIRILNEKYVNKKEKQKPSSFRTRFEKYKEKKKHETEVAREKRYERERVARDERLYRLYVATYGEYNEES